MGTSKYNLEQLGWFNFEQLVRTLLRHIVGSGLSTFSGSVDKGRDATFSGEATSFPSESDRWSGEWIFQVKHRAYSTRGAGAVRMELKRTLPAEVDRILNTHNLECQNYVVITNCPLTAQDKDELHALIRSSNEDIEQIAVLGEADLQELLDGYPKVVSAFPQILGLSQLRELVNWSLHRRSLDYLHAAQAEIATFVATTPYLSALELLHRQHFCILSGPPKMGKTSTAYALAASFSALSYEVYDLRCQRDFYDAYRVDSKQLFICDDVFGDISMRAAERDDWCRGFLRLMSSLGSTHKLVWTAREYILKEALASSRLKEERPALTTADTITVAVDHLSRLEKAMILYNHARVASLPPEVCIYLRGKACITITDHQNYSPESIRQLCTGRLVSFSHAARGDLNSIEKQVNAFLSAPGDAWKTAYLAASAGERLLCTEVMAAGGGIQLSQLRRRYDRAIQGSPIPYQSFDATLASAHGTFLRRKPHLPGDDYIQFYHPSMRDLLSELIQTDKTIRVTYLTQLSLKELAGMVRPLRTSSPGGSDEHRIAITDSSDIDLLQDHIKETLLPAAELLDALVVITDLHAALVRGRVGRLTRAARESSDFGDAFWMVLDLVVPYLCTKQFWQKNSGDVSDRNWRRLFEHLRSLLPLASTPATPEYVPELIRRRRIVSSVDFWGLVSTVHRIVPTIVEHCLDLGEREACRVNLVQLVEQAIREMQFIDLANDYEESQHWHDEYRSIPSDCEEYATLFPDDDEIPRVAELLQAIEDYPRLEDEPEDDHDYSAPRPSPGYSDTDIQQIFSDL